MFTPRDTIAAIATPPGHGGIGIVRLSGPDAHRIAAAISGSMLTSRHAHYLHFRDAQGALIDDGIALFFAAPHSYTGEDVVELQAHGSPAVLAQLLDAACSLGARHARPGEYTERAFLEGRLDLAQAEAVSDLIAASDIRAARAARRALDGEFSRRVNALAAALLHVRIHCEAAIDFADEPLDTLGGSELRARINAAITDMQTLLRDAESGRRLRDGLHAVIVGAPNVGKSSLLNALAGVDRAIVTDIAGTTRDTLVETVHVEGVELTLVDTAGLRDSDDAIEREGMRRAHVELQRADIAIVVLDARDAPAQQAALQSVIGDVPHVLWVANKCDLLEGASQVGDAGVELVDWKNLAIDIDSNNNNSNNNSNNSNSNSNSNNSNNNNNNRNNSNSNSNNNSTSNIDSQTTPTTNANSGTYTDPARTKKTRIDAGIHTDSDTPANARTGTDAVEPDRANSARATPLQISALTGIGLDVVRRTLRDFAGGGVDGSQGSFTARARHVDALRTALDGLDEARSQLSHEHLDLAADALMHAHDALGSITGRVDADALLGRIFSSFCVGK